MKQIEIKTEDIKTITENVNEVINIINSIEFIITPDELKTILSINNDNVWCGGVNSFIIEEIKERLTTEYINDKMGLIPEDVTDELYNIYESIINKKTKNLNILKVKSYHLSNAFKYIIQDNTGKYKMIDNIDQEILKDCTYNTKTAKQDKIITALTKLASVYNDLNDLGITPIIASDLIHKDSTGFKNEFKSDIIYQY